MLEYGEKKLRIDGPLEFVESAYWALDLLKEKLPERYTQIVAALPQMVYDPERVRGDAHPHAYANSDGFWSDTGATDRWFFLKTIAHEARHCTQSRHILTDQNDRERDADFYANTVLAELGHPVGWVHREDGLNKRIDLALEGFAVAVPTQSPTEPVPVTEVPQQDIKAASTGPGATSQLFKRLRVDLAASAPPVVSAPAPAAVLGRAYTPDLTPGDLVTISLEARFAGMYVLGATETGKSTLLKGLIQQDIKAGRSVVVIETQSLIQDLLPHIPTERLRDVVYVNTLDDVWAPGINPFECSNPDSAPERTSTTNRIYHLLDRLWGPLEEMPQLAETLRHITIGMIETNGTMVEAWHALSDPAAAQKLADKLKQPMEGRYSRYFSQDFWQRIADLRTVRDRDYKLNSTKNKIDSLVVDDIIRPIVGQQTTTIPFEELFTGSKIFLFELSSPNKELTRLLGSLIIMYLLLTAERIGERPLEERLAHPVMLYADEFDNFASEDFKTIFTEGRKYGIAPTVAHQVQAALSEELVAAVLQSGTVVSFRAVTEDAKRLAGLFDNKNRRSREPVWQQMKEPIYKTRKITTWNPPEAKQKCEEAFQRYSQLTKQRAALEAVIPPKTLTETSEETWSGLYDLFMPTFEGASVSLILQAFTQAWIPESEHWARIKPRWDELWADHLWSCRERGQWRAKSSWFRSKEPASVIYPPDHDKIQKAIPFFTPRDTRPHLYSLPMLPLVIEKLPGWLQYRFAEEIKEIKLDGQYIFDPNRRLPPAQRITMATYPTIFSGEGVPCVPPSWHMDIRAVQGLADKQSMGLQSPNFFTSDLDGYWGKNITPAHRKAVAALRNNISNYQWAIDRAEEQLELFGQHRTVRSEQTIIGYRPVFEDNWHKNLRPGLGGLEEGRVEAPTPIMEPTYPLLTVDQARAETENELTTLDPQFAKIRVRTNSADEERPTYAEHFIRTIAPPVLSDQQRQLFELTRMPLIQASSRRYMRPRVEVEDEIVARRQPAPPPSRPTGRAARQTSPQPSMQESFDKLIEAQGNKPADTKRPIDKGTGLRPAGKD